jgi:hypothetical protein
VSHQPGCICLECELAAAESKAWDSLSRYKFQMFGYWSAIWVHLNRIGQFKRANPWRELVAAARDHRALLSTEPTPKLEANAN